MIDIGVSEGRARPSQTEQPPTVSIAGAFRVEGSAVETKVKVEMPVGVYLRRLT